MVWAGTSGECVSDSARLVIGGKGGDCVKRVVGGALFELRSVI